MKDLDPNWLVRASLERLGHSVPDDFTPDPTSPLHSDLQLLLASTLVPEPDHEGPRPSYDADYPDWELWSWQPRQMGLDEQGRYRLGHFDGGNYVVVVLQPGRANPEVGFHESGSPGNVYSFTPTLSSFLHDLVQRP